MGRTRIMMNGDSRSAAQDLLAYIGQSPSPWHATATAASQLRSAGFEELEEAAEWKVQAGGRYFTVRDESSIVAFRIGHGKLAEQGFRIVGAHTDSPGLRIKPRAAQLRDRHVRLGVEVYGGPILATFADRDLTLAGRVLLREGDASTSRLVHFNRPLLRLPNIAIHMNRQVNEEGLRFDPQEELPLFLTLAQDELPAEQHFRTLLAGELGVDADRLLSWELAVADTQPGAVFGVDNEFIAAPQIDNLASCHAGLTALLAAEEPAGVSMCAFFDHEEVGSQSYKGADGSFLGDVLSRVAAGLGCDGEQLRRACARGLVLSADMAHAWHPNFARFYDEQHPVLLNGGPVIKINAKQRYATDARGEAYVQQLAAAAGVPCQKYVHRSDLPCGSTVGPITAARLGIRAVDIGNPMWSMHSLRESAGVHDHARMIALLTAFFSNWASAVG
jgi:aspartyl aminopeptidase